MNLVVSQCREDRAPRRAGKPGENAPDSRPELVVRRADAADQRAIASLRASWHPGAEAQSDFERRIAAWLTAEGERRDIWIAELSGAPAGMASLAEYRRMPSPGAPDAKWGYIGNMFVREAWRGRGIGSALLAAIVTAADDRGYERLVLSPSPRAVRFFERAGFVVPDATADGDRLLVRPTRRDR